MGLNIETSKKSKTGNNMNWLGAGLGAAGSLVGMMGQRARENRTNKQQEKLMGIQQKNQMKLNEQGRDLSMDLWNKTGYGAQMEQMKDAGVNPALMYGSAGSGGSTSGMSGGGAGGGSAAQPQQMMDIGANGIDGMMKMAQIKNIDADTEDKKASAEKRDQEGRGIFMDQVAKEWSMLGPEYREVESTIKHSRYGDISIGPDSTFARNLRNESLILQSDANIKNVDAAIKQVNSHEEMESKLAEYVGVGIKNELMKADIDLKSEQARGIYHKIITDYINAGFKGLDSIINAATRGLLGPAKALGKSAKQGAKKGPKYGSNGSEVWKNY